MFPPNRNEVVGTTAAVRSKNFQPLVETLGLVCSAIGTEASALGGCVCHARILPSDHRPAQKLKLMKEATGRQDGKCPWKGRCATRLAMGHMHVMVNNVKLASSPRCQAFLF